MLRAISQYPSIRRRAQGACWTLRRATARSGTRLGIFHPSAYLCGMSASTSDRGSPPRVRVGERQTRQRQVISQVIRSAAGPLTVHDIHKRGQEELPALGIATVYRTVKLLLDEGLIQPVILPSGDTRYESTGLGHHHHFHCRVCDEVFDLESCPVQIPRGKFDAGFTVEDHELTLYGTCPACA